MKRGTKTKARKAPANPSGSVVEMIQHNVERSGKIARSCNLIVKLWPTSLGVTPAIQAAIETLVKQLDDVAADLRLLPGAKKVLS